LELQLKEANEALREAKKVYEIKHLKQEKK